MFKRDVTNAISVSDWLIGCQNGDRLSVLKSVDSGIEFTFLFNHRSGITAFIGKKDLNEQGCSQEK